ncbi:hypothetical protein CHUAL_005408 [Chamberlinius hualienensis]
MSDLNVNMSSAVDAEKWKEMFGDNVGRLIEEKDLVIRQQLMMIDELKIQVKSLCAERDGLSCEVSKLKLELEMNELGRLSSINQTSSAAQKSTSERINCGPIGHPPSLKQLKSYSVSSSTSSTTTATQQPSLQQLQQQQRLQRQRNFNANGINNINNSSSNGTNGTSVNGHRRLPCRTTEDIIKSTRLPNGYELSQDLLDKQVEVLERKYGGQSRAGHAALTIQRAFRRYCMVRKFEDITNAKSEKRLSRRFNGATDDNLTPASLRSPTSQSQVQQNYAAICHELNEAFETANGGSNNGRPPRPVRSLSLREKRQSTSSNSDTSSVRSGNSGSGRGGRNRVRSAGVHLDEDGVNVNSESEYSDTSGQLVDEQNPTNTYCSASNTNQLPFFNHQYNARQINSNIISPMTSLYSPVDSETTFGALDDVCRRNSSPQGEMAKKKIPPEIPKRVSSISSSSISSSSCHRHPDSLVKCSASELLRSPDGGSLSSVQSSGSESSLTGSGSDTRASKHNIEDNTSFKHSDAIVSTDHFHPTLLSEEKRLSNISENSEDSFEGGGYCNSGFRLPIMRSSCGTPVSIPGSQAYYKVPEVVRKRQYRVGLNLFNKKPEKGINYLINRAFLENTPQTVARFLISRKGLSKQMIGDYLGNLQNTFNMQVLECFANEIDLAGMQVDVALRKFQTYFRMPGEAQKIERLVEVFSSRYCDCNRDIVSRFHNPDTVFILAFAIIMLNTDLHTPNMKPEKRMKAEDFVKNLRGIDDGLDIDLKMLMGIYERIKSNEFRPGSDHVTQVMKVQQTIVGKKPTLALPHRRLVCYCRLYEVNDINKKERQGVHQREVFLFNDLLVVTKIFSKKKNSVTYTFRQSFPLCGLQVSTFEVPHYPHGIHLSQKVDGKIAVVFNARNEHDRSKFVEDLKESILEMDEMENLRIENELEKQKLVRNRSSENRDSGVADMEIPSSTTNSTDNKSENGSEGLHHRLIGGNLKRSALSNSLLDIHESSEKPQRRGSAGSLDSGMSVSFQSSAASLGSRDSSPHGMNGKLTLGPKTPKLAASNTANTSLTSNPSFLGGLFSKKSKSISTNPAQRTKVISNTTDSTEV